MLVRIFAALLIMLCFTQMTCSSNRSGDAPLVSGQETRLELLFTEFNRADVTAAFNNGGTYFLLFLPSNHSLTTVVNEQIETYKTNESIDVSCTQTFVVRYEFGRTSKSIVEFNALFPNIVIPKDPYLMMMIRRTMHSKIWLAGKTSLQDVAKLQIRSHDVD